MSEQLELKPKTSKAQDASRVALGVTLMTAGISHLTFAREPFKAQVPPWIPLEPETVVVGSGFGEIALGAALAFLPRQKALVGCAAAGFFTAIFPGNIAQYRLHRSAFGLDTDGKRLGRLIFQPLLIAWALWSSGALEKTRK